MTDSSAAPSHESEFTKLQQKANSRKLALPGVILLTGPLIGLIGTVVGMISAFGQLEDGNADPSRLAGDINVALMSTAYGVVCGLLGVILVALALYNNSNREPWFLKSVCILAPAWCFVLFPFGIIITIYLYTIFLSRKSEFEHTPVTFQ